MAATRLPQKFLLIFLPVAVLLSGVLLFFITLQSQRHAEQIMLHETSLLGLESGILRERLRVPLRDTLYLAQTMAWHVAELGPEAANRALQKDFTFLGQSLHLYDQLRFLDAAGRERVRVNFSQGRPSLPRPDELQDKSDHDYFKRGMACETDLYMSRFDLNVESGIIETPFKPTIRFAVPLRGPDGRHDGLIVLNYLGKDLITHLQDASDQSSGRLQLLNTEGKWLLGPHRGKDFSFLVSGEDTTGFAEAYPEEWAAMRRVQNGQIGTPNGLFTFRTVYVPSMAREGRTIRPETEEVLTLVSVVGPRFLVPPWRTLGLAGLGFVLLLVGVMSLLVARARVRAEDAATALAEAKQRLSYALDGARDGVWDWNIATGEVAYSRRWKEMLGYDDKDLEGSITVWKYLLHPNDKEMADQEFARHLRGETPHYEATFRMRCKDGGYKWVLSRGRVVERAANGDALRAVGTHADLTQRIEIERSLEASRRNLAEAQALAHLGSWELDPHSGELICSDEVYRILGLPPDGPRLYFETFSPLVHADDRERLHAIIERLSETGGGYTDRHRIIRPDGEERWLEGRGMAQVDEGGHVRKLTGTVQDVTDSILAQRALEEREALLDAISQASHDAIAVIDDTSLVQLWNPAAERMFGYGADEIVGHHLHKHIALSEDQDKARSGLAGFSKTGQGPVVGVIQELTGVRKNGLTFPVELSVASFTLGGRWFAVGGMRDITERKEAERALRELATTDGLTGLFNRRHFMELAEAEIHRAKRYGQPMAAIMFDVDHFKRVNDTYGHDAGDEVLRALSALGVKLFREVDVLGRLGGEEFGVFLPQTSMEDAMLVAERMRAGVEAAVIASAEGDLSITISIGLAALEPDVEGIEALLKHCDLALYTAKNTGRNKVVAYAEDEPAAEDA